MSLVLCGLAACGFQLRGQYQLPQPLQILHVVGDDTVCKRTLVQALMANGVRVSKQASARLVLSPVRHQKRVLALSAAGNPIEYELLAEISVHVPELPSGYLMNEEKVRITRVLSYSGSQALSADVEAEQLRGEMERALALRIMRLLSRKP